MLSWLMLSLALVLSHSPAGFLSVLLGLLRSFLLAGVTRVADRRLAFTLSGLCAAGLFGIIGIGGARPWGGYCRRFARGTLTGP